VAHGFRNALPGDRVEDWIEAARRGDAGAFGRLLDRCQSYLLALAHAELGQELQGKVGASDLVQETFLEAQRDFPGFQGKTEAEFHAWLRQILLHNLANAGRCFCRTEKRDVHREVPLNGSRAGVHFHPVSQVESPRGEVIAREEAERLVQAIARLPERCQEVIRLRQQQNLPFAEIGNAMNLTAEAARKLWSRAIDQLRRELNGRE
jgi:RNA polymerase sigma-70 factor (ECF subfamily)